MIEAMKQALEALKFGLHVGFDDSSESQIKKCGKAFDQHNKAIAALRQAIQEATLQEMSDIGQEIEQEPVAYAAVINGEIAWDADYPFSNEPFTCFDDQHASPLYLSPPKREWVGLTDEELIEAADAIPYQMDCIIYWDDLQKFVKDIEAKLKEKNKSTHTARNGDAFARHGTGLGGTNCI